MRAGSTPAIVLRTREFGESDKIVTVLSRAEGKFTGIAKGAKRSRRRFPGALEIFSHVNLDYRQKNDTALCFLERAVIIQPWRRLLSSLECYAAASHVVEIADKMTADREVGDDIYALVVAGLARLEERPPLATTLRLFELAVLTASGYRQRFDLCFRCRTSVAEIEGTLRIPHAGAGLVCPRCAETEHGGPTISKSGAAALFRLQAAVSEGLPGNAAPCDAAVIFDADADLDALFSERTRAEVRLATATLLQPHVRGRLRVLELMGEPGRMRGPEA